MFLLALLGWVFFRSTSFAMATGILATMFTPTSGVLEAQPYLAWAAIVVAGWWSMSGPNVFEMRHSFTPRQRAIATVAFAAGLALISAPAALPFCTFSFDRVATFVSPRYAPSRRPAFGDGRVEATRTRCRDRRGNCTRFAVRCYPGGDVQTGRLGSVSHAVARA